MRSESPTGMPAWRRLAGLPAGRRTRWLVLGAWMLVILAAGPLAGRFSGVQQNEATSYLPADSESTRVFRFLTRPGSGQGSIAAIVLYVRDSGLTTADQARIETDRRRMDELTGGQPIGPPTPSQDGKAVLLSVPLEQTGDSSRLMENVHRIRQIVAGDRSEGLQVKVTGPAAQLSDFIAGFSAVDRTVLLATVIVVALVLLVTYRSPVLWLLPLMVVGIAYTLASAVVYLLASRAGLVVNSQSGGILPVLVFGAGTDYALLLIARYREELRRHADRHQAMAAALGRAAPAILASGATVAIGLLCLLAAELNSNRGLGPVGAVGIACAFLAMVTLLPALLAVLGRWLFWPFTPGHGTTANGDAGGWARIGQLIGRRPRLVWLSTVLALVLLAGGATQLKLGLSQSDELRPTPESVVGQRLLAAHFPAGTSDPTLIVARAEAAQAVAGAAGRTTGVSSVLPGRPDGDRAIIPVVLTSSADGAEAQDTVARLRKAVHAVPGADALVGGDTAVNLDTRNAAIHDEKVVTPLVLAVVLVVLMMLLRAVVAPLLLVATVVVSFVAALGASTLIFVGAFRFPAVDHTAAILGFVFLVALGVDYNIFLVTRVREEVERVGHREGVLLGLAATGGVITSAGVVLAATFSVLAVLPLVALVETGVLVAVGVLLDTFIVRSVLVPALLLDAGARVWWPSRLRRSGRVTASHAA